MTFDSVTGCGNENVDGVACRTPSTFAFTNTAVDGDSVEQRDIQGKRPKRKVAIIFGYVGERYYGLQWNRLLEYPTVEAELLRALHITGMISTENYEQEKVQQKLNWERASRTDKGVHALRNVISVKIMLPFLKGSTTEYDPEKARRLLMEVLPPDIIVYEIVLVTRSFNAYMLCRSRKYEYYLPTFALMTCDEYCKKFFPSGICSSRPSLTELGLSCAAPTRASLGGKRRHEEVIDDNGNNTTKGDNECLCKEIRHEDEKEENRGEENSCDGGCDGGNDIVKKLPDGSIEKLLVFNTIPEDVMRNVAQYRISPEQLEHARSIFRLFEGTHSYHNFTPSGQASDPSSSRYIVSVTVGDPFVIAPSDAEVMHALENWTPSRCYSQANKGVGFMQSSDAVDIEEERKCILRHLLSVYGNAFTEEKDFGDEDCIDNSGIRGGLEMVRIELHGQSFMLNQIRKMVGAVISMCAAGLPPVYLRDSLLSKRVRCGIPLAPANGLFLSYLDFQPYNWRLERIQNEGGNGKGKKGVYVDRVDEHAVAEFRRKIVAVILRNEMMCDIMGIWMRSLRHVLSLSCSIDLP